MKMFWCNLEHKGSKKPHEHKARSLQSLVQSLHDDFKNYCAENPNTVYNCAVTIKQLSTGSVTYLHFVSNESLDVSAVYSLKIR